MKLFTAVVAVLFAVSAHADNHEGKKTEAAPAAAGTTNAGAEVKAEGKMTTKKNKKADKKGEKKAEGEHHEGDGHASH
jgi:hypothetical protein